MTPTPAIEIVERKDTPLGELVLRRRRTPSGGAAHEILLAGALLMASAVDETERALATLALEGLRDRPADVLVGGLGLGATAEAALAFENVRSVTVIEFLPEVIDWHRRGLLPAGPGLTRDPRCRLLAADVFSVLGSRGHRRAHPEAGGPFDAILLDVDNSPEHLLHAAHGSFYAKTGLARARARLTPGGVLAVWAAGAPSPAFLRRLAAAFPRATAHPLRFHNLLNDAPETHTIYVAGT